MSVRHWFAVLALVVTSQSSVIAQSGSPEEFVRTLYRRYAGVTPDRATVDVWVRELAKGTSAAEVHAQILGSNQAYDYANKNVDTWLRMMYSEVIARDADAAGLRHWEDRLEQLRYDRVKLAREFLRSAGAEINNGGGNRPGAITPAELPAHLKTTADLLSQAVTTEYPGYQNFMLRSQADTYAKSVGVYQTILTERERFPTQFPDAVKALSATLDALERGVAQTRLPGQSTRLYLDQSRELLEAITRGSEFLPGDHVGPPEVGGGERLTFTEARNYQLLLEKLSQELVSAEATFRTVIPRGWASTQLMNRVNDISVEVDRLRSEVRSGFRRTDLVSRMEGVTASAVTVTDALNASRVDVRATQAWFSVNTALRAANDGLAVGGSGVIGGGRVPAEAFRAIDRSAAECEALVLAFTPYSTYNRSVSRLIADLQDLKNRYSSLRRAASGLSPTKRELDTHLDAITDRLTSVNSNWREVVRDPRLSGAADLIDLSMADRTVVRLIAEVK